MWQRFRISRLRSPSTLQFTLVLGVAALLPMEAHYERSSAATRGPDPGIDYVQREVIVTLAVGCGPVGGPSLAPPQFGIAALDDLIEMFDGIELVPAVPGSGTNSGHFMERMFLFRYAADVDAQDVVAEFEEDACIEYVGLNEIVSLQFYGTKRFEPDDVTTEFERQWNLDTLVTDDRLDIDAPEAWAIQAGASGDQLRHDTEPELRSLVLADPQP